MQEHPTMDSKNLGVSFLIAFLLVGSGLFLVAQDSVEEDPSENAEDTSSIEKDTEVDNAPGLMMVDAFQHPWDGMNATIGGFVSDESPSTSTVQIRLLDNNFAEVSSDTLTPSPTGSWSFESNQMNPGSWIIDAVVVDAGGQTSSNIAATLTILSPVEAEVDFTFAWDAPVENETTGTIRGVVLHTFPSTCTIEYHPLGQSPALLVEGVMNSTVGTYLIEFDTSSHNTEGDLIAGCGLFTDSDQTVRVNLPMPPEPVGDADGDAVEDDVDECPNTPEGEPVYATGCSDSETDDDADGVMNDVDLCPMTPIGQAVDANGCSASQKDDDNDGVTNDADLCPSTPSGESVDAQGCSESQKDDDGDGVANDIDICPNTPTGEAVDSVGCSTSQTNPPVTRPKILALHGGGESASAFESQQGMQDLMATLTEFDFVFASSPESGNVWIRDPPGGKGEPTTDPDWADTSIAYLDQVVQEQGPFYGLIGYSQGAAMIPVYLANTNNVFNRVMLYNGYLPTTHEGLMDTVDLVAPFSVPAMVFSGENDEYFKDLSPALAQKFTASVDLHSPTAGHHLPYQSDSKYDEIITFIRDGITPYDKMDSWLCLDGQGAWAKDLNGDGNSYTANTRGAGQEGGGGGSGPWFQCSVSVTTTSTTMEIDSNSIPNHDWLSAYAANADEQTLDWTIPLNPVNDTTGNHASTNCPAANGDYECAPDRGPVGVAVNGVPIFGPEEGPGGDAVALEFLYFNEDRQPIDLGYCGAHNGPAGVHYHYDAMCQFWQPSTGESIVDYDYTSLDSTQHSPIIGWAFDGYPIYGMYGWNENGQVTGLESSYEVERTSEGGDQGYNGIDDWNYVAGLGDLDMCNGRFAATPEFPEGTYHYVSTPLSASDKMVTSTDGSSGPMIGFPYFLLCYHGEADMTNADSGGPGGGGGPGGFGAQVLYTNAPLLESASDEMDFGSFFLDFSWVWLTVLAFTLMRRRN